MGGFRSNTKWTHVHFLGKVSIKMDFKCKSLCTCDVMQLSYFAYT
jgi:hypothetical protein